MSRLIVALLCLLVGAAQVAASGKLDGTFNPATNGTTRIQLEWGAASLGDISTPGDYGGDGKTDITVWRPSEGNWYIIQNTNGATVRYLWSRAVMCLRQRRICRNESDS